MINLCLVVIATQFSETKQREHALMKSEQRARQLHQSASTLASDSQPGSCYEEIIRYLAHLGRKAWRRLSRCCSWVCAHFRCTCTCLKSQSGGGGGSARGGAVGEMNGLANRHSGHAPNDLLHLHQLYHLHQQHHKQTHQPELAVSNGGNGFNYPFILPLLSRLDGKGRDQKRMVATETLNRAPQLVLDHGENVGTCVSFVRVIGLCITVLDLELFGRGGVELQLVVKVDTGFQTQFVVTLLLPQDQSDPQDLSVKAETLRFIFT